MSGAGRPPVWHALHFLPEPTESLIDIGCSVGATLDLAKSLGVEHLHGMEIDADAARVAQERFADDPNVAIHHGSADTLPLVDASVEVATCLEVLEHIPESLRPAVLREIHRVLKPHGTFIVTVPHAGLFDFLDPANLRFQFPRLYRLTSELLGGRGREAGFQGQKHGVVRHHHFALKELEALTSSLFTSVHMRWRGALLLPLCAALEWPFLRKQATGNLAYRIIRRVHDWDYSIDPGEQLGYDILLVLEKRGEEAP